MSVFDCHLLEVPSISEPRGQLCYLEAGRSIGFDIKRIYYVCQVPKGEARGAHAHKKLHQFMLAISGSFEVTLEDGENSKTFILDRPDRGLYIVPGIWRSLRRFSDHAVCMVLASDYYSEEDYIRDYEQFQNFTQKLKLAS